MPLLFETDGKSVKLYHYVPSDIAAYIFMGVFGVGAIAHIFFMFQLRAKHFFLFILGCIMECGGYYGRVWNHRETTKFGAFILQAILLLIAPIFFAATMYMTLGRIVKALEADHHSSIRPSRLTKVFVLADLICFITQLGGVGMQVTTDLDIRKRGVTVCLIGLIIQEIVVVWFFFIAMAFDRRLSRQPSSVTDDGGLRWKKYLWGLYGACVATFVRNIVRIFEYAQGFNGFIMHHEAMLYIFDALMMSLVVYIYVLIHPGRLIKRARITQSRKLMGETTEMGTFDER